MHYSHEFRAYYYSPSLIQSNVDTPVTFYPGTETIKRIKWPPHLMGWIHTHSDNYSKARAADQHFQQILMDPNSIYRYEFKAGQMFVWNNFRILHGRQKIVEFPRTVIGQTVPEDIVQNRFREIQLSKIQTIPEPWLVHLPNNLLTRIQQLEQNALIK